jgi:GntR family transcriptional regulator, transcriptional repressor for pyruvate dehydrogenase complex
MICILPTLGNRVSIDTEGRLLSAPSRTTQLAEIIRQDILSGRFGPGDKLPTEHSLIARFGVSRTVVREAISALRARGLVVTRQGAGAFVSEQATSLPFTIAPEDLQSLPEVLHIMQLRLACEVEAAGAAAARRDRESIDRIGRCLDRLDDLVRAGEFGSQADFDYHVAIAEATGNPYFGRFAQFLGTILIPRDRLRLQFRDAATRRDYLAEVQQEHRVIYGAIRDGDVDLARNSMRAHLEASRRRYRILIGLEQS